MNPIIKKRIDELTPAAESGDLEAMLKLYHQYSLEESNLSRASTFSPEYEERLECGRQARFWLDKALNANYIPAILCVADKYFSDYKKKSFYTLCRDRAVEHYTKAASLGSAYAMYRIGTMFEDGYMENSTDETALIWYQNAANKNYGDATYRIALFQLVGRAGLKEDVQKAFAIMTKAAEQGNGDAALTLGEIYSKGCWTFNRGQYKMGRFKYDPFYSTRDFPRDTQKAVFWFKKAHEYGHRDAKSRLLSLGVII